MPDLVSDTAGRVLDILKRPGDRVEAGETVVVVEAMKMEIPVAASAAGTVKTIAVAVDDMIEEDDLLATIDA